MQKKLKENAHVALTENWRIVLKVAFIAILLNIFNGRGGGLMGIFFMAPMVVGIRWFYLDVYDDGPLEVISIFDGFRPYWRIVGASFMVSLFIGLWTMLFGVPGIIKMCSYSQTIFLMKEDPSLGVFEAITKSRQMMDGKKLDYFLTILSFWKWLVFPFIVFIVLYIAGGHFLPDFGVTGLGRLNFEFFNLHPNPAGLIRLNYSPQLFNEWFTSISNLSGGARIFDSISLVVTFIYMTLINLYVVPYYHITLAGFYRKLT